MDVMEAVPFPPILASSLAAATLLNEALYSNASLTTPDDVYTLFQRSRSSVDLFAAPSTYRDRVADPATCCPRQAKASTHE